MTLIGKCTACDEPCNVITINFGIGSYEFWGAAGVDKQIEAVSDCCEAPAVDLIGHDITVQMIRDANQPDPDDWVSP